MSFLTRIFLLTLFVGSCVPQMAEDYILHTLKSVAARQDRFLQKFDEQETKLDLQQTMIQALEDKLLIQHELYISEFENLKLSVSSCATKHQFSTFHDLLETDECERNTNNCSIYATCRDSPIHFICSCMAGYSGDGVICEDINECETTNHLCHQYATCNNTRGGYTCECLPNYYGDGFTCHEIKGSNCKELLDSGVSRSGVYTITPEGFPGGVEVYCDQERDGGGWTTILKQKKQGHQLNFNRTFQQYSSGFGDPNGELWIGNRVLHSMTGEEPFTLRVDAKNLEGESRTGIWDTFSVGSEDTEFTLSVADYSSGSTLGDALWKPSYSGDSANKMKFSTIDRDNDRASWGSCSARYGQGGGWWYNDCGGTFPTAPMWDRNADPYMARWGYWESSSSGEWIPISEIQFLIRP